jgi:hypothetical protein
MQAALHYTHLSPSFRASALIGLTWIPSHVLLPLLYLSVLQFCSPCTIWSIREFLFIVFGGDIGSGCRSRWNRGCLSWLVWLPRLSLLERFPCLVWIGRLPSHVMPQRDHQAFTPQPDRQAPTHPPAHWAPTPQPARRASMCQPASPAPMPRLAHQARPGGMPGGTPRGGVLSRLLPVQMLSVFCLMSIFH